MSANELEEKTEKMPEIQASYVARFLKQKLGSGVKLTSAFRQEYSKSLSIFIYYILSIAQSNFSEKQKKKRITKQDIINALNEVGFENISEQLQNYNYQTKQPSTSTNKKRINIQDIPSSNNQQQNQNLNQDDELENQLEDFEIQSEEEEGQQLLKQEEENEQKNENQIQNFNENNINQLLNTDEQQSQKKMQEEL